MGDKRENICLIKKLIKTITKLMHISNKMICTNSASYLTIDSPLLQVSLYSSLNKNYRWHNVHASNKTGHRLIDSWIYLVSLSTLTNNDWTKCSNIHFKGSNSIQVQYFWVWPEASGAIFTIHFLCNARMGPISLIVK